MLSFYFDILLSNTRESRCVYFSISISQRLTTVDVGGYIRSVVAIAVIAEGFSEYRLIHPTGVQPHIGLVENSFQYRRGINYCIKICFENWSLIFQKTADRCNPYVIILNSCYI